MKPAKLTLEQIELAREMRKTMTLTAVGAHFGVNRTTIRLSLERDPSRARDPNTVRKPRVRYTRKKLREMREIVQPKILAALEAGGMIASDIAAVLGVENVKSIAGALCSLERRGLVDRCGAVGDSKNPHPLFCLPQAKVDFEIPAPPRPIVPALEYASLSAMLLGDPPKGRSALDRRMQS